MNTSQVQPHRLDRLRVLDEPADSQLGEQVVELLLLIDAAAAVIVVVIGAVSFVIASRRPVFLSIFSDAVRFHGSTG